MITEATPPKTDIYDIADRLWETADELRANSHLKAGAGGSGIDLVLAAFAE